MLILATLRARFGSQVHPEPTSAAPLDKAEEATDRLETAVRSGISDDKIRRAGNVACHALSVAGAVLPPFGADDPTGSRLNWSRMAYRYAHSAEVVVHLQLPELDLVSPERGEPGSQNTRTRQ